ncbi:MAG TPA: serine/threonine-protein kinase [Thermoleophilaceae bacterium]
MRLAVRKSPWHGLEEGSVVDGYVVDAAPDVHTRAEVLYRVTAPDGPAATLVAPTHTYPDRRKYARIRRLARVRLELSHPALIPLRAVGEHEGQPYLVTELQPQRTFDDLLEEIAPLEPELLLAMLRPIAEALDLAHGRGLVHEELTGASLLLADDRLMLDSFGLFGSGSEATWANLPVADVRYVSPEQMLGEPLTPAANVYSLAALVVHGLTGAPPYQGPRSAVTYGHMAEPPPLVSERRPELDAAVDEVIAWGMAKDPWERPRSAMALLEAVDEALGGTVPAGVPRPLTLAMSAVPEASPAVGRAGRRRESAVLAVVVAAAVACGALAAVLVEPFGGAEARQPAAGADAPAVRQLAARRADLRAELAAAKTPQDQAAAARQLATAYDDAARALPWSRVAAAAGTAAVAYSDLAAAGEAGDESGYSDAADAVAGAERRLSVVTRH